MDRLQPLIESLRPYNGALLAFGVALAVAFVARRLRRPILATLAAGIGVLAGWWFAFGLLTASPRQLPERLPLLVLGLLLLTPVLAVAARGRPRLGLALAVVGAALVGWWIAGAPMVRHDLLHAAPTLLAVSAATFLLASCAAPRWAPPVATGALLLGLAAAGMPGPQVILAAALLAATLGAAALRTGDGRVPPVLAALTVAGATMALAAIPVIARGEPADWAAATAPLCVLAAPLGARLAGPRAAPVFAAFAGIVAALFAFLAR